MFDVYLNDTVLPVVAERISRIFHADEARDDEGPVPYS